MARLRLATVLKLAAVIGAAGQRAQLYAAAVSPLASELPFCRNGSLRWQAAQAACARARDGATLCATDQLLNPSIAGPAFQEDSCGRRAETSLIWTADTCSASNKRGATVEGRVVFRSSTGQTSCLTSLRRTKRRFMCCKPSSPSPAPSPIPASTCGDINDREVCQRTAACSYHFDPLNSAKGSCHPKDTFCDFHNVRSCHSRCAIHRCQWSKAAKKCSVRQTHEPEPPRTPSECASWHSKGECAEKAGCEWVSVALGEKTIEYGCHPKGEFCGFSVGLPHEIKAQCEQHADRCVAACDECRSKARARVLGPKPPHIILSVADDMGWDDIGLHNPHLRTPTLDGLARDGVRLDSHYTYRFCSPSRSMLLTGNMPWRHGQHNDMNLNPMESLRCALQQDMQTLPSILKSAGYATHMVGKWHLGHFRPQFVPTRRGFDSFLGTFGGAEMMDVPEAGLRMFEGQKCSCPGDALRTCSWNQLRNCATALQLVNASGEDVRIVPEEQFRAQRQYADFVLADEAARIIRAHNPDQPFFLFASWLAPHDPHIAPKAFNDLNLASIGDSTCAHRVRLNLAGMMSALDAAHDLVLAALRDMGMWDSTLLVFLSDNGGHNTGEGTNACPARAKEHFFGSNYPLRGSKFTFWEGGIRTVSFLAGPALPRQVRGASYKGLFAATDWLATLLSAAGIDWFAGADGQALDSVDQWAALTALEPAVRAPRQVVPVQVWSAVDRFVLVAMLDGSKFKFIAGYPGYIGGIEWIRKDRWARRNRDWERHHIPIERVGEAHPHGIDTAGLVECAARPCVFNLTADPSETAPIDDPRIAAQLVALLAPYISMEVPLNRADLCALDRSSILLDGAAMAQAKRCGAFVPWLQDTSDARAPCLQRQV